MSERDYILAGNYELLDRLYAERKKLKALLRRAADTLQEQADGDMNDSLAMEIYQVLGVR